MSELEQRLAQILAGVAMGSAERAHLAAALLAELPAMLEIYARHRAVELEAVHVVIVDERAGS